MGNSIQYLDKVEIDLGELKPSGWLLRPIDFAIVTELARSIENIGLLQPIVVRREAKGFEIVFGNHRLEACRRLGFMKIQALVCDITESEAFLARISENLLRNAYIDPIVEAEGYRMLVRQGWTINAIGKRVGKSDSYVCERLSMLDRLDRDLLVKILKRNGRLSPSHLEILSKISDKTKQRELAAVVEDKKLSVRALENLLVGIPLPTEVFVEGSAGQFLVRIPDDFAKAVGISQGQRLRLHIRGKKIVLENLATRNKKRFVKNPNYSTQHISEAVPPWVEKLEVSA